MNIVYLHQHYRTPAMGGGTRSYEFSRRLVERGHDVNMIASDPGMAAGECRTSLEHGVLVHWFGVAYSNSMSYRQRIKAFGEFARLAAKRAAGLKQDLVFATSTPLTVAAPGIWSKWRNKVPMVFEVRDLWPEAAIKAGALNFPPARWAAQWLERAAYRNAAHVIALSPYMAADINCRFPKVSTTVIPNGCDTDLFADADGTAVRKENIWLGSARPLIVYAGTLGHVNDIPYLVHMAANLATFRPDVRIVIIGSGAVEDEAKRLAGDHKVLENNLFFLPPMPKRDVAKWLAAAHLGIVTLTDAPHLAGSCPNKAFDTWAAGTPLAVNYRGWIGDLVYESGAGVILPPNAPGAAAEKVIEFLNDGDRQVEARLAAHKLAYGEFSRDDLFGRFAHVLETAASR